MSAMTATHLPNSHLALTRVRLSWRGAGWHPHVQAAASVLCVVALVIALAVLALGTLTGPDTTGRNPPPIPRNAEPSPFHRAP